MVKSTDNSGEVGPRIALRFLTHVPEVTTFHCQGFPDYQ